MPVAVRVSPSGVASAAMQTKRAPRDAPALALLDPVNTVQEVHAVVLSGGSAFGLDAASGVLGFTPTSAQVQSFPVTVTVTDSTGLADSQSFTLTVADVPDPPSITSLPPTVGQVGQPIAYAATAEDPDAGALELGPRALSTPSKRNS